MNQQQRTRVAQGMLRGMLLARLSTGRRRQLQREYERETERWRGKQFNDDQKSVLINSLALRLQKITEEAAAPIRTAWDRTDRSLDLVDDQLNVCMSDIGVRLAGVTKVITVDGATDVVCAVLHHRFHHVVQGERFIGIAAQFVRKKRALQQGRAEIEKDAAEYLTGTYETILGPKAVSDLRREAILGDIFSDECGQFITWWLAGALYWCGSCHIAG